MPPITLIEFPAASSQTLTPAELLARVGGKGANLIRLSAANFPVPRGFILTTAAYDRFVAQTGLAGFIQSELEQLPPQAAIETLEALSQRIRAKFSAAAITDELRQPVVEMYAHLGAPPVAVRSSATAEDLPDLSFAGQQDTFLGILGSEDLLTAVRNCWSSLWTARAMAYRLRNGISQADISLAVVVQAMVPSEASGVMFTANPLTGLRSQVVIDASFGLGEAIVSGKVEPDHYVVDQSAGKILEKTAGKKQYALYGRREGGTFEATGERSGDWALNDELILRLANLGAKIAQEYQSPQDIEWALADGQLYLLQTRAITSLFPTPDRRDDQLRAYFSFGAVQGYLEPVTPFGRDLLRQIFATGASMYGLKHTSENQPALVPAGERLWVDITSLMRNTVGRKVLKGALRFVEPTVSQALEMVWDDLQFLPGRKGLRPLTLLRILRFYLPVGWHMLQNILQPAARRAKIVHNGMRVLSQFEQRLIDLPADPYLRLEQSSQLFRIFTADYLPRAFRLYLSGVASGMASWNLLRLVAEKAPARTDGKKWSDVVLEVTRGLPNNPTTEMDLQLWKIAAQLRGEPEIKELFETTDSDVLAAQYLAGTLPPLMQNRVTEFLEQYGSRGLGEIDGGTPRWRENPTPVLEAIGSFLQIDLEQAPDVLFKRSAASAGAAVEQICTALRSTQGGWFKARRARFWAVRMRNLMGLREQPKFFAVRLIGLLRAEMLKAGAQFVALGVLEQVDDLMFLTQREQTSLARREAQDWKKLIAGRRAVFLKEKRRRLIPRLLLSDGRAFYEGMRTAYEHGVVSGSPVSPGVVRGKVRVVFNPHQAGLLPGEVLVCQGTDPSWTPLFMTAAALVMEVGGMMTHGAVVAREYGIPAVVGVDRATEQFKTGQWVEVDGSTGKIAWLDTVEEITTASLIGEA